MRVFDAFLYSGMAAEPALLQLRLDELAGVVDAHICVEGTRTFQGAARTLCLPAAERLYVHVVDLPEYAAHPMQREKQQRDAIKQALDYAGCEPDDLVIISDADELPRPEVIAHFREYPPTAGPARLGERLYHYWLNLRIVAGKDIPADGYVYNPVIVRRWFLDVRGAHDCRWSRDGFRVPDAAWSWSFLGDVEMHREKLHSWSHFEWDRPPYNTPENIAAARREGRDWDTDRNLQHVWVPIDDTYPRGIREHLDRWQPYIGEVPACVS